MKRHLKDLKQILLLQDATLLFDDRLSVVWASVKEKRALEYRSIIRILEQYWGIILDISYFQLYGELPASIILLVSFDPVTHSSLGKEA